MRGGRLQRLRRCERLDEAREMRKILEKLNQSTIFIAIAVAALVAGGALFLTREEPAKNFEAGAAAPSASASPPPAPQVQPVPSVTPVAPPPPRPSTSATASSAEATFMAELRDLWKASPGRALELARSGEARFGDSAEAAERSWVIVRALTELGRHEEARAEGRKLLERYRDTTWAQDVYRHLFVNPPTHASERGFGKTLEGE